MKVVHNNDVADIKIGKFPYRGKMNNVIRTSVRWLSKHGDDGHGYFGIRAEVFSPFSLAVRSYSQPFLSSNYVYSQWLPVGRVSRCQDR